MAIGYLKQPADGHAHCTFPCVCGGHKWRRAAGGGSGELCELAKAPRWQKAGRPRPHLRRGSAALGTMNCSLAPCLPAAMFLGHNHSRLAAAGGNIRQARQRLCGYAPRQARRGVKELGDKAEGQRVTFSHPFLWQKILLPAHVCNCPGTPVPVTSVDGGHAGRT